MGKGGIPDRWLPYTPMGSVVPGTCFIACKVPLKDALLKKLPMKERFGPRELMNTFPTIGLLIDLTNTTRYYMKEEFTKIGIKYKKIFCPGHVVPPNSIVREFNAVVDTFLKDINNTDLLIAVHCTHGVNRTGYFICRYMVQKMNIPPEDAVKRFQEARGHKIERQIYVDDLKNGCKGGFESDCSFKNKKEYNYEHTAKKERRSTYHDLDYNWRDTTNTHKIFHDDLNVNEIEDKPSIVSNDINMYNHNTSISRGYGRRGHPGKRKRHQNSQPMPFNCSGEPTFISNDDNVLPVPPNSYVGRKNGPEDYKEGFYLDQKTPNNRHQWNQQMNLKPPHNLPHANSHITNRLHTHQTRVGGPPPPHIPYQSQNRMWVRPSGSNSGLVPQHQTYVGGPPPRHIPYQSQNRTWVKPSGSNSGLVSHHLYS